MNPRSTILFLAALLIPVAVETLPAQTPSNPAKEIAAIREQWVTNWNAKQIEPIVKLYAEDAILLTPTGQRIEGRNAIGNYLRQLMNSGAIDLSVRSLNQGESSKLAFDSGTFLYTLKGAGTTISGGAAISGGVSISGGGSQRRVEGGYLIVLKRGTDGKWLIEQHASTEVPPPAK